MCRPKQPIQALRLRVQSNPRSTVIRITNRTNSFLELVKGETRLAAVGTSGGHLSSSPLNWEDEEEDQQTCAWLCNVFNCCGGKDDSKKDKQDKKDKTDNSK